MSVAVILQYTTTTTVCPKWSMMTIYANDNMYDALSSYKDSTSPSHI